MVVEPNLTHAIASRYGLGSVSSLLAALSDESPDEYVWTGTSDGKHSVKSYYKMDQSNRFSQQDSITWKNLWGLRCHERFKVHLWRIARECLPWFGQGTTF